MEHKNYIVFLSIFPSVKNQKDGYIRRVQDIEQIFIDDRRIHIDISLTKNLLKRRNRINENLEVIYCNAILHSFLIFSILKRANTIYSHSILRLLKVLPQIILLGKRIPLVIDVHGAVPEEFQMRGAKLSASFYSYIESVFFRRASLLIHVTEAMQNHYIQKYPGLKAKNSIYYISTQNKSSETPRRYSTDIYRELNIDPNNVVIVYSGNCQVWQNIDLMLNIIDNSKNKNYRFLILTGEPDIFKQKTASSPSSGRIIIKSVQPDELPAYYNICHYGFILRDKNIVNIVANPTKMGEYLEHGITPIVKFKEIGDYHIHQYECLNYSDFGEDLFPSKSLKNQEVFKKLKYQYKNVDLRKLIGTL